MTLVGSYIDLMHEVIKPVKHERQFEKIHILKPPQKILQE
jgi:hypothetical protein